MANVSLIFVSHNKPGYVKQAIQSVLDQKHQDWEMLLVDSGVLLNQGFFDYIKDPRIRIIPSNEPAGMYKTTNMASWCFNNMLTSGMMTGELVMYLCDDDLLYPEAFGTFWDYYAKHNKEPQAMYASQHLGLVDEKGETKIIGTRVADRPAGRFCKGRKLDCQVDYLQFCHTRAILKDYAAKYGTDRPHVEDKSETDHADGIFMEQIGAMTKIHNIDVLVSMNRRTAASINSEHSTSRLGWLMIVLKAKFKGLKRRLKRKTVYY